MISCLSGWKPVDPFGAYDYFPENEWHLPPPSTAGLVIDHGNVGFIPNVDGQHPLGGRFSFPSFPAANSPQQERTPVSYQWPSISVMHTGWTCLIWYHVVLISIRIPLCCPHAMPILSDLEVPQQNMPKVNMPDIWFDQWNVLLPDRQGQPVQIMRPQKSATFGSQKWSFSCFVTTQNSFGYTPAYDQRDHGFGPQSINNNAYGRGTRGVSSTARPFYGKKWDLQKEGDSRFSDSRILIPGPKGRWRSEYWKRIRKVLKKNSSASERTLRREKNIDWREKLTGTKLSLPLLCFCYLHQGREVRQDFSRCLTHPRWFGRLCKYELSRMSK